jgi:hypothetical protein
MYMKILFSLLISSVGLLIALPASAGVVSVGPNADNDYATIKAAVNAGETYITIEDGTYTEGKLNITEGDVYIEGNLDDHDAVQINGRILVKEGAELEMKYVTLNAQGSKYGVKVEGEAALRYGKLKKGKKGVLVSPSGWLNMSYYTVQGSNTHGIVAKKNSTVYIDNSTIKSNKRLAVQASKTTTLYITDSAFRGNKNGVSVKNSGTGTHYISGTLFRNMRNGIILKGSTVSRANNKYKKISNKRVLIKK